MKVSTELVVSLVLMLVAGIGIRSISHGEAVPLRQSFASFPLHIEQWSGVARDLDPKVLGILRVDDYVLRHYQNAQRLPVELYVGYYQSQRRGATYHSPKNCLPGSGWSFLSMEKTALPGVTSAAQPVEINQFIIQKGLDRQVVFYWYQDRGRVITSEYWAKFYLIWDAMVRNRTDGAFVRITVPFTREEEEHAVTQGRAFAETIFPLLRHYLPS